MIIEKKHTTKKTGFFFLIHNLQERSLFCQFDCDHTFIKYDRDWSLKIGESYFKFVITGYNYKKKGKKIACFDPFHGQ